MLRTADRYLGIPILAAAGAVKQRRTLPSQFERLGIVNSTNIGDTVLLSAVLRDLHEALPDLDIAVFAASAMCGLLGLIEGLRPVAFDIGNPREAIRALRRERLDVVLDFDQWPRVEPLYLLLSGARWSGGFRSGKQHRHYSYDGVAEHSPGTHELDNYRRLASLLGITSKSLPRFDPPGLLAPSDLPPEPYAVLHLWPTGFRRELKEWPWERWLDLGRELNRRGLRIVLTGGPHDVESSAQFADYCRARGLDVRDTAGRYDLVRLVDLLAGSRAVVSVNTGVMHLAAATGALTIGLNGPTSETRWGPLGDRAYSVNSCFEGCGFLHYGWEYEGQREDCMEGIGLEHVLAALEELPAPR